ncbi:PIN domain-containing protein [Synechococcus sp. WH 8016]|uniref:PIN domain-containing protein n=1 Tax=Synechococcus sp. WH 8016 TaxID=166318 RepID=UPI00022D9EB0|nr:PIN domain-containing protein [Synechococcus sp. WH 8016]EHA62416.1 PilT protein domain protein [Synechococcus sp. WH 8016]
MPAFCLDTSAILTLRDDEPGAERVAMLLEGTDPCFACFITRMEVLYRVWKDEGERSGRLAYEQLQSLPIQWVDQTEALLLEASRIKALHRLSVADAWIAAAALLGRATLLHKDPEFEVITELDQDWLA